MPEGLWGQTHDLLQGLYLASLHRGTDATGFIARTSPLDSPLAGEVVVAKEPLPADEFIETNSTFRRLAHRRCSSFIGHVRAATHGDPKSAANNHPFASEDGNLYLVHNGVIGNHEELADRYTLPLQGDCDSEALIRLIEMFPHPGFGLAECLREAKGTMAVAMYDRKHDWVWLARNSGRPLWLGKLRNDRRWFFASTERILTDTFKKVLGMSALRGMDYLAPIPADVPLIIAPNGGIIASQPS